MRWARPYRTYLNGWLPETRSARILEVACGPGHFLQLLRRLGYENLSGVDISPEQIQMARTVLPTVLLKDATKHLAAHPGAYDAVFALDFIEHLRRDELLQFFAAARDALAPNGRLVLQTPNCASPWGIAQRYADFTHEIGLTPGALESVLRLSGYANVEVREARPVVHGAKSLLRRVAWSILRATAIAYDLIETGSHERVYTRVFFASAVVTAPGARLP